METKNYEKYLILQEDHTYKAHSCGILLLRKNKDHNLQYLVLEKPQKKSIGLPKGHLEIGETIKETAKRELFEETGIKDGYEIAADFIFEDVVYPIKHQ
jgi:ADP-ribose pyrophosphatase YjhB (NUDIX family)